MLLLNTQCHDGVDNIIVILLQGFDGLLAADVGLCHDELDVLILQAVSVDLLSVIVIILLLLVLLSLGGLDGLAGLAVVVAGVVLSTGSGKLGSGGLLGGVVDVLNLGLTEHTAPC